MASFRSGNGVKVLIAERLRLLSKDFDEVLMHNDSLAKRVKELNNEVKWLQESLDTERKKDKNRDTLKLEQLISAYEDFINSVSDISSEFPRMSFNPDHPD